MEQVPRQQYTKEFREQAVRLVLEQQVTIPEAARRLAMAGRTLERWVCRARQGQLTTLGENSRPVTELEVELSRLKRELAEARMERDILKKATVGSTGESNTCLQYSRWRPKPQRLPWTLIQP
ncbi:MAG: transposase [Nitrospira sp.]|nr:transposase [Nitrospira sp.]